MMSIVPSTELFSNLRTKMVFLQPFYTQIYYDNFCITTLPDLQGTKQIEQFCSTIGPSLANCAKMLKLLPSKIQVIHSMDCP